MSISFVDENHCGDCPIWGDEEFFSVGMRMEKKVPQKRFGMQTIFYLLPHEDSIIENFI
jgi:hypothetical protein